MRYFPPEEYPDHVDLVCFMQWFIGYCLTRETNLQFCLYLYGRSSNAKSVIISLLTDIFGKMLSDTIPIENLSKSRGTNNDSLKRAMHARLVLFSESNGSAKIDVGTYNSLVCGEETTTKGMYEKECNFVPVMKLIFALNDLPEWRTKDGKAPFHIQRRNAYLRLKKQFLDPKREDQRAMINELIANGKPHLIGTPVTQYYEKNVVGHEKAFLRFFVEGAVAYYNNSKIIEIPRSMQDQSSYEGFNKHEAIDEFVSERLCVKRGEGATVIVKDLYDAFMLMFKDDVVEDAYQLPSFGKDLWDYITQAKGQRTEENWGAVARRQTRREGKKVTVYDNITL